MLIELLFAGGLAAGAALQQTDEASIGWHTRAPEGITRAADPVTCDQGGHSGLGGTLQIDEGSGSASLGPADQGAAHPVHLAGCTLV